MSRVLRAFLVAAALFATTGTAHADVTAQDCSARAVVVIDAGGGARTQTICFSGTISGLTALQIAGANPVTYGFAGQGAAVCALDGVGNPADQTCLTGPNGAYWAYYRAGPGATGWTYSRGGASGTTVTDGSVEGWRYGTGAAPGFVSFCAVAGCAPPPTATPPVTAPPATAPPVSPLPSVGGVTVTTAPSGGKIAGAGTATTTTPTTTTTPAGSEALGTGAKSRHETGDPAGSVGSSGGGGSGSPWGVVVVVAVLAVVAGVGYWFRRRRRGVASAPTD